MMHLNRHGARALLCGAALVAISCSVFDTAIENPNAVQEEALGDPASAPPLVNGLAAEFYDWITATLEGRTAALRHES